MKRLLPILVGFGVIFGSPAQAGINLYCQDKMATGFIKDERTNSWKIKQFELKSYKIQFDNKYSTLRGVMFLPAKCNSPYKNASRLLFCVHTFPTHEVFMFDKNSQRYTFSEVTGGYALNNSDAEILHVGTCKKL